MKYRCYLCPPAVDGGSGFEFDVPKGTLPMCPKCESNEKSGAIQRLVTCHFEPPKNAAVRGRKGSGVIACDGKSSAARLSTGDTSVVTCEACMNTDVWRSEAEATGMVHERQHPFFYRPPAEPAPAESTIRTVMPDGSAVVQKVRAKEVRDAAGGVVDYEYVGGEIEPEEPVELRTNPAADAVELPVGS